MKTCPSCGNQLSDSTRFCTNCGASVPDSAPMSYSASSYSSAYTTPDAGYGKKKKGVNVAAIIAVILAVALIGGGIAGVMIAKNKIDSAYKVGYTAAYNDAYEEGRTDGITEGETLGYDNGYAAAKAEYEAIAAETPANAIDYDTAMYYVSCAYEYGWSEGYDVVDVGNTDESLEWAVNKLAEYDYDYLVEVGETIIGLILDEMG